MENVKPAGANENLLRTYAANSTRSERTPAEITPARRRSFKPSLTRGKIDTDDKAWYLQEMARYYYRPIAPNHNACKSPPTRAIAFC